MPIFSLHLPVLLTADLYPDDGQMQDEVYNYGSFLQSKMHAQGVSCSDCHEPHSGKLRGPGNLQLPRPELKHAFVLKPLADIAPAFCDPLSGESLGALWRASGHDASLLIASDIVL